MAMRFMDSVDHYDLQADITNKWTNNPINAATTTSGGRNGRGLSMGAVGKTLDYQNGWVVGAAFNFANGGAFSRNAIYFLSAANETVMGELIVENDGSISIYAGNANTLIANSAAASPPIVLQPSRWYYIECKIQTTGSGTATITATMTARVNGVVIGSGVGSVGLRGNQTLTGSGAGNYHQFAGNGITTCDDFYIADISGSGSINDFVGDIAIGVVYPASDNTFNWTPVGGTTTTGFDHVNPQFPETNDDTTYIKSLSTGSVAEFVFQPVSTFSGGIVAVHFGVYGRKDDEGTREWQPMVHGTVTGSTVSPGDTYIYYFNAYDQDPQTGAPWTQANFNASFFGVKLSS